MAGLSIYDGGTWRKAKSMWVYNGSAWVKAKGAWVYDGGTWRKGYVSEKQASVKINWNSLNTYRHNYNNFDNQGLAKQGSYGSISGGECSGYLLSPNGKSTFRDAIIAAVPDFGSLVSVDAATIAFNRASSGDYGSTRTIRLKQMTNTAASGGPTAVNGYADLSIPGGQGWKYNMTSTAFKTACSQLINQTNGAKNFLMNADDTTWGSVSGSTGWSYNYLSVSGALMDITITYVPK